MTTTTDYKADLTGDIITGPTEEPRTTQDLREFLELLDALGLESPSDEAVGFWEHSHAMAAEARKAKTEKLDIGTLGRQLARGEVTIKQAEKAVISTSVEEVRDLKAKLFTIAQRESIKACRQALREAGDQLLEGPRSLIIGAIADYQHVDAQTRYDAAVKLHGMAIAFGIPRAERATSTEYLFRRPDLVAEFVAVNFKRPTVQDIAAHPEWEPGLFTAEEVIEAAKVYAPEGLKRPSVTKPSKRRGSVVWEKDATGRHQPVGIMG